MTRRTLATEISAEGIALHAGRNVHMTLAPGNSGAGVLFRRSDTGSEIPALYDRVTETRLGTAIGSGGVGIGLVEHLMAAVAGAGIDDLVVTLDGPEPPILDGDALAYLMLLEQAGFKDVTGVRHGIVVKRRVEATYGDASAALSPADLPVFDFEISFPSAAIGEQHLYWQYSEAGFRHDIAPARTFGFVGELEALTKAGLARGASLENTLAIDGDAVVNAGLMRFSDEFVRHKILDAIGDLALAGAPVIGRFEGRKSGHALNNALLRVLFAAPENYAIVEMS